MQALSQLSYTPDGERARIIGSAITPVNPRNAKNPIQSTLPGFMMPFGSIARFRLRISSSSKVLL